MADELEDTGWEARRPQEALGGRAGCPVGRWRGSEQVMAVEIERTDSRGGRRRQGLGEG